MAYSLQIGHSTKIGQPVPGGRSAACFFMTHKTLAFSGTDGPKGGVRSPGSVVVTD